MFDISIFEPAFKLGRHVWLMTKKLLEMVVNQT